MKNWDEDDFKLNTGRQKYIKSKIKVKNLLWTKQRYFVSDLPKLVWGMDDLWQVYETHEGETKKYGSYIPETDFLLPFSMNKKKSSTKFKILFQCSDLSLTFARSSIM